MNWKKLITLDNRFQADPLTDALGKAEIPFWVGEQKDTAYNGRLVHQKDWGAVTVEETNLEEARTITQKLLSVQPGDWSPQCVLIRKSRNSGQSIQQSAIRIYS